jgi:hypothetical protein
MNSKAVSRSVTPNINKRRSNKAQDRRPSLLSSFVDRPRSSSVDSESTSQSTTCTDDIQQRSHVDDVHTELKDDAHIKSCIESPALLPGREVIMSIM